MPASGTSRVKNFMRPPPNSTNNLLKFFASAEEFPRLIDVDIEAQALSEESLILCHPTQCALNEFVSRALRLKAGRFLRSLNLVNAAIAALAAAYYKIGQWAYQGIERSPGKLRITHIVNGDALDWILTATDKWLSGVECEVLCIASVQLPVQFVLQVGLVCWVLSGCKIIDPTDSAESSELLPPAVPTKATQPKALSFEEDVERCLAKDQWRADALQVLSLFSAPKSFTSMSVEDKKMFLSRYGNGILNGRNQVYNQHATDVRKDAAAKDKLIEQQGQLILEQKNSLQAFHETADRVKVVEALLSRTAPTQQPVPYVQSDLLERIRKKARSETDKKQLEELLGFSLDDVT